MTTKGMSLCNPFDLEKNPSIKWQGQILPGIDTVFCQFNSMYAGLRAGYIDIKNSIKEGYNTIQKFVTHYAPPNENDTQSYIVSVAMHMNMKPDDVLTMNNLKELGKAVLIQEQGICQFADSIINEAVLAAIQQA